HWPATGAAWLAHVPKKPIQQAQLADTTPIVPPRNGNPSTIQYADPGESDSGGGHGTRRAKSGERHGESVPCPDLALFMKVQLGNGTRLGLVDAGTHAKGR